MIIYHKNMNSIYLIKDIKLMSDFTIVITFSNKEVRMLDMKPIMEEYPLFHALEENNLFKAAKIDLGGFGLVWNEEFSISAGDAYSRSTPLDQTPKSILSAVLIQSIVEARKKEGLTQSELADLTDIKQPMIAKIEKSNTDPRLSTILTLVDKLGYRLDLVPKHQRRS